MKRNDGLTDDEGVVMDALCAAFNAMATLDRQHPDELHDFKDGIHRCQDTLALRVCRRTFPLGWPNKGGGEPAHALIGAAGSSPKLAVELLREDRSVQLAAEEADARRFREKA